jgi:hypothetical protein
MSWTSGVNNLFNMGVFSVYKTSPSLCCDSLGGASLKAGTFNVPPMKINMVPIIPRQSPYPKSVVAPLSV